MSNVPGNVTVDSWTSSILACPLSKKQLVCINGVYSSDAGFKYPCRNGIPDFRVSALQNASEWRAAQIHFEKWAIGYFDQAEVEPRFYERLDSADRVVYEEIPLVGSVLDVGGQLGFIRNYMKADLPFVSIDPFTDVLSLAVGRSKLMAYVDLNRPFNFVSGFGEFLPFQDCSFDTVNMRSVIDHLASPKLALLEAFRVLKPGGQLIVGLQVDEPGFVSGLRELAKIIRGVVIPRMQDKHIWHPTRRELHDVCGMCGFHLQKEYWQTNRILYSRYLKSESLTFN